MAYNMELIIYNRTSTEDQNPENQLKDCESIRPKDQGGNFKPYDLHQERLSAWRDKDRPEFKEIRQFIKKGQVRDIIVWDLDRLYRDRKKLIAFFEYCKLYKCKVHSFRQPWLEDVNNMPDPWGEIMHAFLLQVMGWIAEEESTKKSDRVKAAVRRKPGKPTVSHHGNRWGRKPVSTFKRNAIFGLYKNGNSIRKIAQEVGLSKSAVHKTITQIKIKLS